jgi:recombinational DNA repair protein (RecF pathway)
VADLFQIQQVIEILERELQENTYRSDREFYQELLEELKEIEDKMLEEL